MPIRDIVRFPDPRLKAVCEPIGGSGALADEHQQLARDLLDTMAASPGCVGIAAPQIGVLARMVVIDVTGHRRAKSCHGRLVLVDPEVVERSGNVRMREGCLSIPDFTGDVRRPERVTIAARGEDGAPLQIECDAFEARVVLHELDHLDGLLFLDRVAKASHVYPRRQYS